MRIKIHLPVLAGAVLLFAGAVMAQSPQPPAKDADVAALFGSGVTSDGPVPDAVMEAGEGLFRVNCRQCHGSRGTAGVPLKENERLADPFYVTGTILTGPGYMTGFADHLDDGRIAAIASFVRNSWGNDYGAVIPQDVADMR